eukprot:1130996-Prymnesium_polylepis.1
MGSVHYYIFEGFWTFGRWRRRERGPLCCWRASLVEARPCRVRQRPLSLAKEEKGGRSARGAEAGARTAGAGASRARRSRGGAQKAP